MCTLLATLYIAWPYLAVWRLYSALRAQNADALSERIDFPSLRVSLKDQMNAYMMKAMVDSRELAENPFAGLAAAFMPKMVESMIDAYVTPSGVTQLFESDAFTAGTNEAERDTPPSLPSERLKEIKYAFFSNPTKFLLKTDDIDFAFRLRDWTWKLAEVKLTQSALRRMGEHGQGNAHPISRADAAPTVQEPAQWELSTDVSPIDDSKSYFLTRKATESVVSGFMSSTPTLMIRYKEGALDVYITFDSYLGSDSIQVTTRIGDAQASEDEWGLSTDGRAIFCPSLDKRSYVRQLMRSDRLVVRLTPYGESPITTTFDLDGLTEAIQPVRGVLQI